MPPFLIRRSDLTQESDQLALVELLNLYAMEPGGGGQPISAAVQQVLEHDPPFGVRITVKATGTMG